MFHLVYVHRLSHGCRDGLTLWPNMLVSPKFPFLILSLSGSTVRRWFFLSIHMLVWISGVTRIWYCRLASSGVSSVNSLTISLFTVSLYNVLMLYSIRTNQNSCAHVDVGLVRPVVCLRVLAATPAGEAMGRAILRDLDVAETLSTLQDQVEGLTLSIPDVRTDELPLRLQRHTTDVPSPWTRHLRMIAQAVTCYHQHH